MSFGVLGAQNFLLTLNMSWQRKTASKNWFVWSVMLMLSDKRSENIAIHFTIKLKLLVD